MRRLLVATFIIGALPGCLIPTARGGSSRSDDDAPRDATAPPDVSFAEVEPVLAELAREWANDHEHDVTIKRTYTLSDDWEMERESGTIVGRVTTGAIYTWDATNQHCWQLLCNIRQDELGGRWGRPYLECVDTMTVTCESVDALVPRPSA